ncbi:MAG: tetratricopeptide repeat protein [bacterium]
MEDNNIIQKIRELTSGFKGKEEPSARLTWLKDVINSYKRYLPPRVVEKIILDPAAKKIEGERRIITVAFADLSGFTALSETMDPEDIANIINDFFTRMLKIVFKYEGSVDKFLGDALMVIFGAPIAHHDDPERAVRAALEMQQEIQRFNDKKKFSNPLAMSIGINTGPAVALNVGSEQRMEYTVIGDAVNLASRLEGVSKAGEIIISHNTYQQIADIIEVEKKPSVRVKGKKKPVLNYLVKEMREHYKLPDVSKLKIVGRQHERQVIESCLEKVEGNQSTILGIVGEPGTGKTRLGLEAVFLARKKNFAVLNARCMPYESNIAYTTIISLFNDYFKIKNESNEHDKKLLISLKLKKLSLELDTTLPYIGVLYAIQFPQLQGMPPNELKRRIFTVVKQILMKESERAPLLIRVEDLQWCDPTSIELFTFLLEDTQDTRFMFLYEYRSDYTFPWIKLTNYKNITLKNFPKSQVNDYMLQVLDVEKVDPQISETIFSKSQGNPLFVQEIVKYLLKKGGIRRYKGKAIVTSRFKDLEIAESISGVILAQIDRMSEAHRRLLQHASVIGKVFTPRLLSRVMNIPIENMQPDLDRLEHFEGVLLSRKEGGDVTLYEFLSPTTYEVTYGSLFKTRRKELHTVIGNTIEQDYGERVPEVFEQLAYHFSRSVNKGKGVHFSKLAAEKSYFLYALKESVNFFAQTLDLLGKKDLTNDEMKMQLEVLRRQGFVLKILGDFENALCSQKRSLRIAVKLNSPKDEAKACINIGIFCQEMGTPKKGLSYFTRARRIAKKTRDIASQMMAVNNLGNYYLHTGDLEKALQCYTEVANLSKTTNDKRMLAFANQNLGQVAIRKTDLESGLEHFKNALEGFVELGEKESIARCLNDIGMLSLQLGNIDNAIKKLNEAVDLASEIGQKEVESLAYGNIGLVFAQTWRLQDAYDKFSQALTIAQMTGDPKQNMFMNNNIGDIHQFRGNLQEATNYHTKAIDIALQIRDPFNEAIAERSLGWDYYYTGDYALALETFEKSQSVFQRIDDRRNAIMAMLGLAATQAHMGFSEEVLGMLQGMEAKAREIKDLEILANALDIKADCLIDLGRHAEAKKILEELPDLSRKIGNKRLYAWAIAKQAHIAACENNINAVQENIKKSMTLTGEIGDMILFLYNSMTKACLAINQENYVKSLNTLTKMVEQARASGSKGYLAQSLWFTAQIFKKLSKEKEAENYLSEYQTVMETLSQNLDEAQRQKLRQQIEIAI